MNRQAEGRRAVILRMLRAADSPLGVAEIAARLDVHPNTVRFHLDALLNSGLVERVDVAADKPGRPPSRFRARPGMNQGGRRNYRLLSEMLAARLMAEPDPASAALEAGRDWGRRVAPAGASGIRPLIGLLDELGFAPEHSASASASDSPEEQQEISLRHCPFLDLADSYAAVICPLHLGFMRGVLEAGQSPVTVERLEPFVEPDRCLAQLAPVAGGPGPAAGAS